MLTAGDFIGRVGRNAGPYSHNTGGSMQGRAIRQGYVSGRLGRVGLGGWADFGCWLNDAIGGGATAGAARTTAPTIPYASTPAHLLTPAQRAERAAAETRARAASTDSARTWNMLATITSGATTAASGRCDARAAAAAAAGAGATTGTGWEAYAAETRGQMAEVQAMIAAQQQAALAQQSQAAETRKTILYVGGGLVAVLVVGGIMIALLKK